MSRFLSCLFGVFLLSVLLAGCPAEPDIGALPPDDTYVPSSPDGGGDSSTDVPSVPEPPVSLPGYDVTLDELYTYFNGIYYVTTSDFGEDFLESELRRSISGFGSFGDGGVKPMYAGLLEYRGTVDPDTGYLTSMPGVDLEPGATGFTVELRGPSAADLEGVLYLAWFDASVSELHSIRIDPNTGLRVGPSSLPDGRKYGICWIVPPYETATFDVRSFGDGTWRYFESGVLNVVSWDLYP